MQSGADFIRSTSVSHFYTFSIRKVPPSKKNVLEAEDNVECFQYLDSQMNEQRFI